MSAVERAFRGVRAMIGTGRLAPGEKLPTEAELCSGLEVSRSSLREALRMLTVLGVLESRRGSGWTVSQLRPDDVVAALSLSVTLLPVDAFLPFLEVRRMLESQLAAAAAARASDAEIDRLGELARQMESSSEASEVIELDRQFHELLIDCGGNEGASALLRVLRSRSVHYHLFESPGGDERKRGSNDEHAELVAALRARDPAWASAVMSRHIKRTQSWLSVEHPVVSFD